MTRLMTITAAAAALSTSVALAGPQPVTPGVSTPSTSVVSSNVMTTTSPTSGRLLFILTPSR
jgi:hypothetical protein